MSEPILLRVDGEVRTPLTLTFSDLSRLPAEQQVEDVSQLAAERFGSAVTLQGLLAHAGVQPSAQYLGLHSSTDDFHASIPLAAVQDRGLLIYRHEGKPLDRKAGGPVRFYIPDHASCHTDEVDECANVKFVDRIELTTQKGHDNRPTDEQEHARLHEEQAES